MRFTPGDRVRITDIGPKSDHYQYRDQLIGLEGTVVNLSCSRDGFLNGKLQIANFPDVPSKARNYSISAGGYGFHSVKVEPVMQQPATTDRDMAWSDYADQMECTASGRPFNEFEGDLMDAFYYGWQAGIDHAKSAVNPRPFTVHITPT